MNGRFAWGKKWAESRWRDEIVMACLLLESTASTSKKSKEKSTSKTKGLQSMCYRTTEYRHHDNHKQEGYHGHNTTSSYYKGKGINPPSLVLSHWQHRKHAADSNRAWQQRGHHEEATKTDIHHWDSHEQGKKHNTAKTNSKNTTHSSWKKLSNKNLYTLLSLTSLFSEIALSLS